MIIAAGVFLNARRIAGTQRFYTGRENKYEYGYYLQLRIASPLLFVFGLAIVLGWI